MLPDFPRSKDKVRKRIMEKVQQGIRLKAPILAGIKTIIQHEGIIHSYDRVRARPVSEGYEQLAVPVTITFEEVPALSGERLAAKIDAIAEAMAGLQMELFYRKHSQSCDEVGNTLNANGATLTADMLLEMLALADMEFGPDHQPIGSFVVGPSFEPHLRKVQEEATFSARYQELVERKYRVWRDRESNRKLVD